MAIHIFNAITYSNKLTSAGLDKKIADVQAEELSNIINNDLVTKHYFKEHLDNRLNALLLRIGGMLVAAVGVLFVLLKYHC